jgi:hypothetical protein
MRIIKILILELVKPVLIWIAEVKLTFKYPAIKKDFLIEIKKRIRPGMVFLSYEKGALSNLVNKGEWKHAAIFVGGKKVVEATHLGVIETKLDTFVLSKDRLVLLRPTFCNLKQMKLASKEASSYVGLEYDFKFTVNNKSKYCVEVVIDAYQEIDKSFRPKHSKIAGDVTYRPDDVYQDTKNWRRVLSSVDFYETF